MEFELLKDLSERDYNYAVMLLLRISQGDTEDVLWQRSVATYVILTVPNWQRYISVYSLRNFKDVYTTLKANPNYSLVEVLTLVAEEFIKEYCHDNIEEETKW